MSKRACLPCRVRKVKCVPNSYRCVRCTALGIKDCTYDTLKKRGPGGTLRMGEACTSCRRRKRKCDAKRPCTTCVKSGSESGCFYEELRTPNYVIRSLHALNPASGFPFSDEHEDPEPSKNGVVSPSLLEEAAEAVELCEGSGSQTARPVRTGSDSPVLDPVGQDLIKLPSSPHAIQDLEAFVFGGNKGTIQFGLRNTPNLLLPPSSSRLSVLPSLRLPLIPRTLHASFSFSCPENFQVIKETSSDLEMTFRLTTLLHYSKLGIYLSQEKQDALLKGETSNAVIHSMFVHQACSYGMLFSKIFIHTPAALDLQARYSQSAWEELAKIQEGSDDYLKAQAMLSICSCCIVFRWVDFARDYTRKTCRVIDSARLQFIPAYGQPPEYSEEVRQRSTVLSQIIYFENYLFLTCGGPEPKLTARIEKEYRHELQRAYPILFKICPLTMRTQAILLVRDATYLLKIWSDGLYTPTEWRQSFDQLIALLDGYSDTLLRNLRRFIEIDDNIGAEIIWSSCITCLTHLSALCELIGRAEPTASVAMDSLCDLNLEKLGQLTEDIRLEEYTYLDLLLGFSWGKSLVVYESRISRLPMEDGLMLRYWKGVVAKAYSTFQEKAPGEEPPELCLLLEKQDGRIEGSNYPNLLQASVRDDYGI